MARKTKLTDKIIRPLANEILASAMPALLDRLGDERFALMKEVKALLWDRSTLKVLEAVPKAFGLRNVNSFSVKVSNNGSVLFNLDGALSHSDYYPMTEGFSDAQRAPIRKAVREPRRDITDPITVPAFGTKDFTLPEGPLLTRIREHQERSVILVTEGVNTRRREIQGALSAFEYLNDLETGWPEVWQFARNYLPDAPARIALPTVSIQTMNSVLGLPVETAIAA